MTISKRRLLMSYQQLLAQLGISYAHPGGLQATNNWMNRIPLINVKNILEIGCGVGKTVEQLRKLTNTPITAIDHNVEMVNKAMPLSNSLDDVSILPCDVENLPFPDQSFDLIICESVLAFTNIRRSLKEIDRVMKEESTLVLNEMTISPSLDQLDREVIQNFYEMPHLYTKKEWLTLLLDYGFTRIDVQQMKKQSQNSVPTGAITELNEQQLSTLQSHYHWNQLYDKELLAYLYIAQKGLGYT